MSGNAQRNTIGRCEWKFQKIRLSISIKIALAHLSTDDSCLDFLGVGYGVRKSETLYLIRWSVWSPHNQLRNSNHFSTHSRSTDRWKFGPCWKMLHVNTVSPYKQPNNFSPEWRKHIFAPVYVKRDQIKTKELTFKTQIMIFEARRQT